MASATSLVALRPVGTSEPRDMMKGHSVHVRMANLGKEWIQGLQEVWRHDLLKRVLPVALLANLSFTAWNVLSAAWVHQILSASAASYGALGMAILVGEVLGAILSPQIMDRISKPHAIATSLVICGLALAAISRVPVLWPDLGLVFVIGIALGLLNTLVSITPQRDVPRALIGRVAGVVFGLVSVTIPLGAIVSGKLSRVWSLPTLFLVAGLVTATSSVLLIGARGTIVLRYKKTSLERACL